MNHDQDIQDVQNIDPNRLNLSSEYRMDFPMLKIDVKSIMKDKRKKKNIPTPKVFELTDIALANLDVAGVKYR